MKTRLAIAFAVLLAAVAYFCCVVQGRGQAFTPLRPFILQSAGAATNPTFFCLTNTAQYHWTVSDLDTNGGNVNAWTDRLQGAIWRMDAASRQPSFTTNGIVFDNTHWLTSTPLANLTTNCGFGFIWNLQNRDMTKALPLILGGDQSGNSCNVGDVQSFGFGLNNNGISSNTFLIEPGCVNYNPVIQSNLTGLANVWTDYVLDQYHSATNAANAFRYIGFTNGILCVSNLATVYRYWGDPSQGPMSLCGNIAGGYGTKLTLKEFWVWTNWQNTCDSLPLTFHQYGTSTWDYAAP